MNKNTDPLKSCQSCRKVWHKKAAMQKSYYNDGHDYYMDFPHYGLPKVKCPKCKKGEMHDNNKCLV
tara:strand:- start:1057 stop:1254 length:198 start_codon:yes stop_codon:yes gene_type:complete